nr:crosslink repair DNA glycosylase YcaQ family protein [Tessaracoccus coleopterorum]
MVAALGAMQGQDLPGVLASAALRSTGRLDDLYAALDDARLVRGYPMRGTVFLMAAADAVWATELCAGPSLRSAASRRHQLGLDDAQIGRAGAVAEEALASGPLPRSALFELWDAAGLAPRVDAVTTCSSRSSPRPCSSTGRGTAPIRTSPSSAGGCRVHPASRTGSAGRGRPPSPSSSCGTSPHTGPPRSATSRGGRS